jgi:long-chain acyl-CoA synthetase
MLLQPDEALLADSIHLTYTGLGFPVGVVHDQEAHQLAAIALFDRSLMTRGEVVLGVLPFTNIFGFATNVLAPIGVGATVILGHQVPPAGLLDLVEKHRPRVSYIVPPHALSLAQAQADRPRDLSSLERVWSGASPFGEDLVDRMLDVTGVRLLQGYGLSEAFVVCCNQFDGDLIDPSSLGVPLEGYQLQVTDSEGNQVDDNCEGELEVRSRAVFKGYFNQPDATADTLREPGRLRTGDRVIRNSSGHFVFKGWIKRITKVLGYTVDLVEVESVLRSHAGVKDVILDSRPHPYRGFVLHAQVTPSVAGLDPTALATELGKILSFYKVPRLSLIHS